MGWFNTFMDTLCARQTTELALRVSEDRLRHEALFDTLTGLHNRAWLNDRLQGALNRARREGRYHLAVLFLDLDRFKQVNDSLGHESGDALLFAVGERLREHLRVDDGLARQGGDEFVVLLEETEADLAVTVAARLVMAMAGPFLLGDQEVSVGVSIGVVHAGPAHRKAEDILRDADIALYQAKAKGKGRFQVYDDGMRERILYRRELEQGFAHALAGGLLELVYQPIVSVRGYRLAGFEALARWTHPDLGPIPPEQFVAIARATNLSVPFGRWVLREVCRRLAAWQPLAAPGRPWSIAVNFRPARCWTRPSSRRFPRSCTSSGSAAHSWWWRSPRPSSCVMPRPPRVP